MRVVATITSEFLRDTICVPIFDEKTTISMLSNEILKRYNKWHAFKIYDFDILSEESMILKEKKLKISSLIDYVFVRSRRSQIN